MENKKMKKAITTPVVVLIAGILSALLLINFLQKITKETDKYCVAMGTVVTIKLYDRNDAKEECDKIVNIINDLENKISWRKINSDIYNLNKDGSCYCDGELKEIIEVINDVYAASNGAFDITVGKVTTLWNIGEEDARVPSDKEIKNALGYVDGSSVRIEGDTLVCGKDQQIDLGAVGKGLACDKIKAYLDTTDTDEAVISVGGSVLLYNKDLNGKKRKVAVRDPNGGSDTYIGTLSLSNCFISTSGDYERVLDVEDEKYHHIIDPKTGYPAKSDLRSVTVICDSGMMSDILSTACFVLGLEEGEKLLLKYNAQGIFVDSSNNIYVTEGLKDSFALTSKNYVLVTEPV